MGADELKNRMPSTFAAHAFLMQCPAACFSSGGGISGYTVLHMFEVKQPVRSAYQPPTSNNEMNETKD
jgi:hypothetical protein